MQIIAIHPPHHNDARTIISEEHATPCRICRASCEHEPNARGTQCQHCGIPAEMVTPDELTEAMTAEVTALRIRAAGQTGWLDTCNACDAIGPVHPVTGYCGDCQATA